MPTLAELRAERARVGQRLRELHQARERGEDWDDDEEIRLSREAASLDAQIAELGGSAGPGTPTQQAEGTEATPRSSRPASGPAGASAHLGAPPETIDAEWNALVERYVKAQQEAADHSLAEREDWTCRHSDPGVHAGCAIWWRGEQQNLLIHLRDAANQIIDDLAGPRTQEDLANGQAALDLRRRELAPLEERIAAADTRLEELLAQFEEDEKVYKALRDAGGDIAPYTGVVSAGRHRLLHDIEQAQQALNALHQQRTAILQRLLQLRGRAASARRERGLAEARRRWPDLFLDLDSLSDDALLRRLLGEEQHQRVQLELQRQGLQLRRSQTRRTSLGLRSPAGAVLVAVLCLLGVVAAVALLGGGDDDPDEAMPQPELEAPTTSPVAATTSPAATTAQVTTSEPAATCVLHTDLELQEIRVQPGAYHQGNVAVMVTDTDGEPVDGAEVAIATDKSDGMQTTASGTSQGGMVIFGMVTTAFGENTLTVTGVTMEGCSWSPESETTFTWEAKP